MSKRYILEGEPVETSLFSLSGKEKEDYLVSLDKSLETMAEFDTDMKSDIERVRRIVNFFSFDDQYGKFESMKIDAESGFPFLTSIQKLLINKNKAESVLEKYDEPEDIRKKIANSCYENNFDLEKLQTTLKIVDFYQALLNSELFHNVESTLTDVKRLTDVDNESTRYTVNVKGYDGTKMSWISYNLELFQKKEKSIFLKNDALTKDFNAKFSFCFGLGVKDVYNLLRIRNIRPGFISRTELTGFYFLGKENPEEFNTILMNKPNATILKLRYNSIEDTDLILSEELDKDVLKKDYDGEFLNETKLYFVATPDVLEELEYHCKRQKFDYKIKTIGREKNE
ncbi:MAG: hypothetical protein ABIC91_05675 [Nanoarchaeota archaeon]|nr:hypothetical protein [Nanoarchaeota archaeon]MBU1030847.1 hypothetical protein [Nanoarchaeota archaeon]MBU1849147.1 hypothetical protein [Nanoarchaeota archaeon]